MSDPVTASVHSPETDPDALRREMLARRRRLPADVVARNSALVVERLRNLSEVGGAGTVGTYLGVRGEVDPSGLLGFEGPDGAFSGGVLASRLALPLTTPGEPLRFVVPTGPLEAGPFGIRQPTVGPCRGEEVDLVDLDVVLVPLVAADRRGNRIGHGAGFYDRTFAHVAEGRASGEPTPLLVGVCHDFQVVDTIEAKPWDIPLDLLVTEVGITRS